MKANSGWIGVVFVMIVLVSGCSRTIQEPWVPTENYLQEERSRSAEKAETLRERLLIVQAAR